MGGSWRDSVLNKPNPAVTMAADNDPTNEEQEVLRMKRMSKSHYSQNKKYSRVSTQQVPIFPEQHEPLTEPTTRRSLATD